MIYLAIIFALTTIACLIWVPWTVDGAPAKMIISGISFIVALVLGLISCVTYIPAGQVGYMVLFGNVNTETILSEGLCFKNPFTDIRSDSVRTKTYTMSSSESDGEGGGGSITVLSSNGLSLPMDVSVSYRANPEAVAWLYQNMGDDYRQVVLTPSIRSGVREAASHFTDEECYASKKEELAVRIKESIESHISKITRESYEDAPNITFVITDVLVRDVDIPKVVKDSIEKKQKAEQEALEMEFKIAKEKAEAERKEIEAGGIQRFQDIVSQGINDNLLKWKGIEATMEIANSPNSKVIVIGSGEGGLPIILGGDVTTTTNNK